LQAIGLGTGSSPDPSAYDAYMAHFEAAPPHVLRDCLVLDTGKASISIDEVEPAAEIMKRFCTGGMSLGAISREVSQQASCLSRCGRCWSHLEVIAVMCFSRRSEQAWQVAIMEWQQRTGVNCAQAAGCGSCGG